MKRNILFLSNHNRCRTLIAEAWMNHVHGEAWQAWSAGLEPCLMDLNVLRVMARAGIDPIDLSEKPIDLIAGVPFDCVVVVCSYEALTCINRLKGEFSLLHVCFDDPLVGAPCSSSLEFTLGRYIKLRDDIRRFVSVLPRAVDTFSRRCSTGHGATACAVRNETGMIAWNA